MTLHAGPTSQTFISQRLRLHYLDWGNRGKPPLVLVHGAFVAAWSLAPLASLLDRRVVLPDLLGFESARSGSTGAEGGGP